MKVAGDGPMAEEWRTLAGETGVAGRIHWLGEVPDADLPALYHLADLFVLPASHPSEAFGLVQVEAMAAGLPVLTLALGIGANIAIFNRKGSERAHRDQLHGIFARDHKIDFDDQERFVRYSVRTDTLASHRVAIFTLLEDHLGRLWAEGGFEADVELTASRF